jgi:hypothetical protein
VQLLNGIRRPFKVGVQRGDDDVSLFILYEFVVYAKLHDQDLSGDEVVQMAEKIEELEASAFDAEEAGEEGELTVESADLEEALEVAAEVTPNVESPRT